MTRLRRLILSLPALVAGLASQAPAAVTGKVVDPAGQPLSGAIVHLIGANAKDTTGADGSFSIQVQPTGISEQAGMVDSRAFASGDGRIVVEASGEATSLQVELFDVSGRQAAPAFQRTLAPGRYTFDSRAILPAATAGKVLLAKVRIAGKESSFTLTPQAAESRGQEQALVAAQDAPVARAARRAALDSLKVSRKGYQIASVPVNSYVDVFNAIALDPKLFTVAGNAVPAMGGAVTITPSMRSYPYGTRVTLVAARAAGFAFANWSGSASGSDNPLVVAVDTDLVVQANFVAVPVPGAPTNLTAAALSHTSIQLGWTDGSTDETSFLIERSPNGTSGWAVLDSVNAGMTTYTSAGLGAATTYHFRVSARGAGGMSAYSNVASATTAHDPARQAVLRIRNNTKYDITSIKLNNVEQLQSGYILPIGAAQDYLFTSAGSVTVFLMNGVGINDYFTWNGTMQVALGRTDSLVWNNLSIAELLANFKPSASWRGSYFDANHNMLYASFTFYSNGTYQLYNGTTPLGNGSVSLVSWPDRSSIVTFRIGNSDPINMMYPFASFQHRNGPPSWPIIEYWRQ